MENYYMKNDMFYQYGRTNAYNVNNDFVEFNWVQFKLNGTIAVVIREGLINGISLTNSIEYAIARLVDLFKEPILIFQDCGEEGVFQVYYTVNIGPLDAIDFGRQTEIVNPKWEYFSKDLTGIELLYGRS